VLEEKQYWQAQSTNAATTLPFDYPAGENTVASTQTLSMELEKDATSILLHSNNAMTPLLLTMLAQTIQQWTDVSLVHIDLERHGREEILAEADLSRTVGWFTALFPLTLDLKQTQSAHEALKEVEKQLQFIPSNGINYGIIRYLLMDKYMDGKNVNDRSSISFNYMGQFDQIFEKDEGWMITSEARGLSYDKQGERPYLISVNCIVNNGFLQIHWNYSENIFKKCTIEYLAQSYVARLKDFSISETHRRKSHTENKPEQFSAFDWDQTELDTIFSELKNFHD
jgi:non-ribosomal peptide synthase protein (TIGR01720 family)